MSYGAPPPPPQDPYGSSPFGPPQQGTSGLAIGALICGILGFVCCPYFVLAIAAVVLGILGLNDTSNNGKSGRGLALAGLILGGLSILIGAGLWILSTSGVVQSKWS